MEEKIIQILLSISQKQEYDDVQETLFKRGLTPEYIVDNYEKFDKFLTQEEKIMIEEYAGIDENEIDEESLEKYKNPSTKSFVENPEKKINEYLSFLDCTCDIPSYIVSFLEILGEELEERADVIYQNSVRLYGNNFKRDEILYRELPVNPGNLGRNMIKKKRNNSIGDYTQKIKSHFGFVYIIRDLKDFKKLCETIEKRLNGTETHASFGNQDFRYLISMYRIMYKIDCPTFTAEDKILIKNMYFDFYLKYQQYKEDNEVKNMEKLFIIIQYFIEHDEYLRKKYSSLLQYIIQQNEETQQKNMIIFDTCKK